MGIGTFIRGAAIGAAAMYFFDPRHGQARREMAQAKLQRLGEAWNRTAADGEPANLGSRIQAMLPEARSIFSNTNTPASDNTLAASTRSSHG
jgi:gas vesicle protein